MQIAFEYWPTLQCSTSLNLLGPSCLILGIQMFVQIITFLQTLVVGSLDLQEEVESLAEAGILALLKVNHHDSA